MTDTDKPPSIDALSAQHDVIATLLRSEELLRGDLSPAVPRITEAAARLLDVARVSVWLLEDEGERIGCIDLWDRRTEAHTRGGSIARREAPAYFRAIAQTRTLSAPEALLDVRTRELADSYLAPLGIASILDVPILVRGRLVGVLCHEHVGSPRRFRAHEELMAGTLADVVGTAVGAAENAAQSRELASLKNGLERLVEERTEELRASRENLRKLFEVSPVALVVTRFEDQTVLVCNDRAAQLFETSVESAAGQRAPDFWARPEDRQAMLTRLRVEGRVEGVEAALKTTSGRRFWGSLSATLLNYEGESALLVGIHDITAKKLAEGVLRENQEALRTMLEAAPVPLVVTGLDDALVRFSNQRAADMFELPLGELVGGRAPDFYVKPDDRKAFVDALNATGRVDTFAAELRSRKGRTFWALLSARTMVLRGDRVFMVGFADLTEQKEVEARLREVSVRDGLTGIFNRRHFFEMASQVLEMASRHGWPVSFALIDADHFKAINDRHGHVAGDDALRMLVRGCRKQLRASDVFARYGGEELVVLMPETSLDAACSAAERMRAQIASERIELGETQLSLTVSIGVVQWTPGEPIEALLKRADDALYRAKAAGRNRIERG